MYRSHQEHYLDDEQWGLELELKYELLSLVEVSGMRKNNPGWVSAVPYAHGFFLFSESEKVKLRYRNTEAMEGTGENQGELVIYHYILLL